MPRLLLIALLGSLAGCSLLFGEADQNRLDDARAQWTRAGLADYAFTLFRGCFCGDAGSYRIQITGGEVTSIQPLTPPEGPSPDVEAVRLTIDDLFGVITRARAEGADELAVDYDDRYGFPVSIAIDYIRAAVDDELTYRVSDFQPLP